MRTKATTVRTYTPKPADIERTVAGYEKALRDMAADGSFKGM